jgi:aminotransferase
LCRQWDVIAIMDEIYEHIVYDGVRHVAMMSIEGMAERTVSINSLSKTFSVTGWRVGWAVAAPALAAGIRKVHDFLTVNAPAPMQEAGVFALGLADDYYRDLATHYQERRDRVIAMLRERGFACFVPSGAYYVMTDVSGFGAGDDVAFAKMLIEEIGVAAVPGSSFYRGRSRGRSQVRFCFCKRDETLAEAERRLAKLKKTLVAPGL